MADNEQPHPLLDMAYLVMFFPVRYLPGWEVWNSTTSAISFQIWGWYSFIGGITNSLLWGFFLVWIYRLVARLLTAKSFGKHEDAA
ncbi:MAG: hypothetical protein ABR955_11730 [Verrucomicrobiota bacterium]|jgi:hypothetical protein